MQVFRDQFSQWLACEKVGAVTPKVHSEGQSYRHLNNQEFQFNTMLFIDAAIDKILKQISERQLREFIHHSNGNKSNSNKDSKKKA